MCGRRDRGGDKYPVNHLIDGSRYAYIYTVYAIFDISGSCND